MYQFEPVTKDFRYWLHFFLTLASQTQKEENLCQLVACSSVERLF